MLALVSCNSSSSEPEKDLSVVPAPDSSVAVVEGDSTTLNQGHNITLPPSLTGSSSPVVGKPLSGATGALNPEHGMPGHRCEIAVGAPLNSAPSTPIASKPVMTTTTTPTTPSTVIPGVTSGTTPAKPATGARLNPPHGEPGHDCAVQVGQPLN